MATQPDGRRMVRYQFQIDDETWREWKETVPRSKSLEQRIIELIEADRDGRVEAVGDDVRDISVPPSVPDRIDAADARAAIAATLALVEGDGGVQRQEIIAEIAPQHPLGYDDIGERGAWWRKIIRPALEEHARYENGLGWVTEAE
jgi:hypothetical protein